MNTHFEQLPLTPINAYYWITKEKINFREAVFLIAGYEPLISANIDDFPLDIIRNSAAWVRENIPMQEMSYQKYSDNYIHNGLFLHNDSVIQMQDLLKHLSIVQGSFGLGRELLHEHKKNIVHTEKNQTTNTTEKKGKRDQQIEIICKVAIKLNYDPLDIPEEGKQKIFEDCKTINSDLFTKEGFNHAWKEANKREKIRITNKEKYISQN